MPPWRRSSRVDGNRRDELQWGEKKECRFLYQLCRRGHNKRTMQWVRLRHGMAWHGRRDKGFFAVHLPCRLASTFIPVWPPLTLVAVNLWLAPSKALILGLLLKGFKDHNVVYLKCKDSWSQKLLALPFPNLSRKLSGLSKQDLRSSQTRSILNGTSWTFDHYVFHITLLFS